MISYATQQQTCCILQEPSDVLGDTVLLTIEGSGNVQPPTERSGTIAGNV